jgi:hypothetical protein
MQAKSAGFSGLGGEVRSNFQAALGREGETVMRLNGGATTEPPSLRSSGQDFLRRFFIP